MRHSHLQDNDSETIKMYGIGWIVEVKFNHSDNDYLRCWHVEIRDACIGEFTCFAVFENEKITPHVESY